MSVAPYIGGTPGTAELVDGKQLVDLDETYEDLEMERIGALRSGLELYRTTGKLSRGGLAAAGLTGIEHYDPIPSKLNAVRGQESFIQSINRGFLGFIKTIIEYIKRGIQWIVSRIKVVTGFAKTSERIKASNDKREALAAELTATLSNLGLDKNQYNFDTLLNAAPEGLTRIETIEFIKNKMDSEEKTVARLKESRPLIAKVCGTIRRVSTSLNQHVAKVKREIRECENKLRKQTISIIDTKRLSSTLIDLHIKGLQVDDITKDLAAAITALTDVTFSTEELNAGFAKTIKKAELGLKQVKNRVDRKRMSALYREVAELTEEIVGSEMGTMDMGQLPTRDLSDFIAYSDAESIEAMAVAVSDSEVVRAYTEAAAAASATVTALNQAQKYVVMVEADVESFCKWKDRCDALLAVYMTNDLTQISAHIDNAIANEGYNPRAGITDYVIIDPEVKKWKETISETAQGMFNANLVNLKTMVNNFSRQTGLGFKVK